MLVKADAKALEWRVKADLAKDKVAINEILNHIDQHTENQNTFGLPSRLIAKIFVYRMIFADAFGPNGFEGPAYAYANDPDFSAVSTSKKFWTKAIERFYDKYQGMYEHSVGCIREATTTGFLEIPTGRRYQIQPKKDRKGEMFWPRTEILNYPVQGFGADIMREIRLSFYQKLTSPEYEAYEILPINTVHDDIELDVDHGNLECLYVANELLLNSFSSVHLEIERKYGYLLSIPMEAEVKFGFSLDESKLVPLDEAIKLVV